MLEFRGKAACDIFDKIRLTSSSFFEGQLSSLGEFLIGFTKNCFEHDPCFIGRRETIPVLDGLLEFFYLVKNGVCLGDLPEGVNRDILPCPCTRSCIQFFFNVVDCSDGFIMHVCHFFLEIIQMAW